MEENEYISPQLTALELYSEGVPCDSNEIIIEQMASGKILKH